MGRSRVASLDTPIRQQPRALSRPPQRGARAGCPERALHPRPGGRGLRGGVRALPRRAALRGRGQRHRRADDRAARARRGPGRRGGDAVLHLLRDRRGGDRARRPAGVLRHRPRHVLRHPRHRQGGAHPAHQGDRAGGSVRQRRAESRRCASSAYRWSRTPRRQPAPRSTGRAPEPSATSRRSPSSPRRTCPAWATAARSSRTTTSWPSALGFCASTGRRTRSRSPTWATTRVSTSCRRPCCACCCRSWTGGPSAGERWPPPTSGSGWASTPRCRSRPTGAEHAYHLYVVRAERELPVGRGYYRTPVPPPAGGCATRTLELPATEEAARTNFALPMGTDLTRGPGPRGRRSMRIWVDLTNSPHVLVMRPLIEAMRADGHEVEVTARDFAQTLELCERFGIEHTAIGRHRGGRLASQGTRAGVAQRRARALGARAALRRGDRPRVERRERGRSRCCGSRRHGVRLRVRGAAAPRELPALPRGDGAGADPARATRALRREAAQAAPLRGPEGGVLPGGLRARRGRARTSSGSRRERPLVVVRTPPDVSLYHRFENPLFPTVLERLAQGDAQVVVLPRTSEQREEVRASGSVRRARARRGRAEPRRATPIW